MSAEELQWFWPSNLDGLDCEETDTGFDLSAPTGSECADWLNYWNQSSEHIEFFNQNLLKAILDGLDH
jgi:hypothetical protein